MLKMEIIKFDPQDVVTASVAAISCICEPYCHTDGQFYDDHTDTCHCLSTSHVAR